MRVMLGSHPACKPRTWTVECRGGLAALLQETHFRAGKPLIKRIIQTRTCRFQSPRDSHRSLGPEVKRIRACTSRLQRCSSVIGNYQSCLRSAQVHSREKSLQLDLKFYRDQSLGPLDLKLCSLNLRTNSKVLLNYQDKAEP